MTPRKFLVAVYLALLGACASDPVVEKGPVNHGAVDAPMTSGMTADVEADVAAFTAGAVAEPRARPTGPALDFAALQSCAHLLIAANRHGETLQSSAVELIAERQHLYEARQALRRDHQALNGVSEEGVADYAAAEKKLSRSTDNHRLKVGFYNASLRNFKTRKKQYRRDCAHRPYSGKDLAALADVERAEMKKGFMAFKLPRL